MQSKRSFFNKTVFRKNITRFAPVWILYTLCLLVELAAIYSRQWYSSDRAYWFTEEIMWNLPEIMGILNLFYGLLVAQMLFGDLYNGRMCSALHALPMRRENWFLTNVVTGFLFSAVPTLIAALALLPLLAGSVFVGVWKLPFLFWLCANLEFLCFFGMAVFAAMCVGSRFTMLAGYGVINAGAAIAYWIINTIYTPLLYGVITPSRWADELTPMTQLTRYHFFQIDTDYSILRTAMNETHCKLTDLEAFYSLTGEWWRLFAIAAVGLAMLALALLLYRKRDLECAGDAVAFPILRPVFLVLCTIFVAATSQYVVQDLVGYGNASVLRYCVLALGLVVGWFIGKMLLERTIRVFRKQNWYGLGALAALMVLSLLCTHFDILGIETRLPDPEKIEKATMTTSWMARQTLEGEEQLEKVLRIHRRGLENRPEGGDGLYIRGYDGNFHQFEDTNDALYDRTQKNPEYTYAVHVVIEYTMKDGSEMSRYYSIWADEEEGNLTKQLLGSWEVVSEDKAELEDGSVGNRAEAAADNVLYMLKNGDRISLEGDLREQAWSFLDAVRADCAAGNMIQDSRFHRGVFRNLEPTTNWNGESYYEEYEQISLSIGSEVVGWSVSIFPESANCIRWLQDRGLLDMTIDPNACLNWRPVEAEDLPSTVVMEEEEPTQPSATKPTVPETKEG